MLRCAQTVGAPHLGALQLRLCAVTLAALLHFFIILVFNPATVILVAQVPLSMHLQVHGGKMGSCSC